MKTSEADLLIVPGWQNSGPDHWQSRWERQLKTARRVEQADWEYPLKDEWVARLVHEVGAASRPVVLIAHSCGATAVAHAAQAMNADRIAGAFLVAPPDMEVMDGWPANEGGFAPTPLTPMPFPSILVASSDDPYCTLEKSRAFADAWGSTFIDAGPAGHINTESGHGPWPEGLMQLGWFLKRL